MLLLLFFVFLGFPQNKVNPIAFIKNSKFTRIQSGQKKTRLNFTIFEEKKQSLSNSSQLLSPLDLDLDETKWSTIRKIIKQNEYAGCDTREQDAVEDDELTIIRLKKQFHTYQLLNVLKNPHISQKRKLDAWYKHMDHIECMSSIEKKSKYVFTLSQGGLFSSWDFDFE